MLDENLLQGSDFLIQSEFDGFKEIMSARGGKKIKINIAVMYSLSGDLAFISDTLTIAKLWQT